MALRNHIPTIRELIPGLMGGSTPPTPPPERAGTTLLRTALVSDGTVSTYVVPGDFPEHTDQWFRSGETRYPPSADNEFEHFRDAREAYPAMKEAMETATGQGHFIILVGWSIHIDFDILEASTSPGDHADRGRRPPPGGPTPPAQESPQDRTLDAILRRKTGEGVMVRVLVWAFPMARQNDPSNAPGLLVTMAELLAPPGEGDAVQHAADTWAPLSPGLVMRADPDNHSSLGSHHQKVLLVNGTQGLIGFYGGLDYNPDRTRTVPDGAPQHDIHARVRGPAADDLLNLVRERWDSSFPVQGTVHGVPDGRYLSDLPATAPLPATREPRVRVQIGHTVGNPHIAQGGWTSNTWSMIEHAIQRAQRFIYVEDQYIFSEAAVAALALALRHITHLTILVPGDRFQGIICELRHWALRRLLEQTHADDRNKIGVYERTGTNGAYVHAKSWIFDDELAIIGSANCNRRGYQSDSEVIGVSSDLDWPDAHGRRGGLWYRLELDTAHSLRMRMWQKHLGVPLEDVHDGVASAYLWRRPEPTASVMEYQPLDNNHRPVPWRTFVPNRPDAANNVVGRIIDPPRP
jgi:phosphatidylserine/phosphatidylglycerophosphate/cardiolipin synthase-like enzyme